MTVQTNVYGITLLSRGVMVSLYDKNKPFVIGKKFRDSEVGKLFLNSSGYHSLSVEDQNNVNADLKWAFNIIKKSFAGELSYQCVISYPDWMTLHQLAEIRTIAEDVGLHPLRFIGNLSVGAIYAESLNLLPVSRWLLSSIDETGISIASAEVGDGVIEMRASKNHFRLLDSDSHEGYLIESTMDSLIKTHFDYSFFDDDGNPYKANATDTDYVLIGEVPAEVGLRQCIQSISALLNIQAQSILIEESAYSLGCAIQAGVLSGGKKETLLLDISGSYSFGIETRKPPSYIRLHGDAVNHNGFYTLINAGTTIPTKRGESILATMFAGSTISILLCDSYDRHESERLADRFCRFLITNKYPEDQEVELVLFLDIDANNLPSVTLEVRCGNHNALDIQHESSIITADGVSILRLDTVEDANTSSRSSNSQECLHGQNGEIILEQPENPLDFLAPLYLSRSDASIRHERKILINDECEISVQIPPGIREGQKLRVKGKGNFQPGTGRRGDLYLQIVFTEDEIQEHVLTVGEVEAIARETDIFDGTTVFTKVLGYIRDENAALQSNSRRSNKVISILTTAGSVGAAFAGLTPLAGALALGRLAANSGSTQKLTWSLKEIDDIKEICDLTQKEIRTVASRFGQPLGRFIHKDDKGFNIYSVFHHQSRGFTLVTLAQAYAHARCFTDEKTHQLIASVLLDEFQELYNQLLVSLYPSDIFSIKGIRLVKPDIAKSGDPNFEILAHIGDVYRFDYIDGTSIFGYKVPIPVRSDF